MPTQPPEGTPHADRRATGVPARAHARWVQDTGPQVAVLVGVLLMVLGLAGFAAVLDSVTEGDDVASLDQPVLTGLVGARSTLATTIMTAITTVSGPKVLPVVALIAALAWGWFRKEWWQAGLLAGAMITSTVLSVAVKAVVARPRPPIDTMSIAGAESTYSFPSGHTVGTATLLLVVGYLAWIRHPSVRRLVLWLVAIAAGIFLVALSRLYLGYHFVTDVVAAVALSVALLGAVVVVDRRRAVRAARVTAADAHHGPA